MNAEEIRVHGFLKLGYFVDNNVCRYPIDFSRIDRRRYEGCTEEDLIEIGAGMLRSTFDKQFLAGRRHVVPLSGGLDSRLILGALLERTDASNIETYTFGIQNTYDYDLGCLVAKHAGTRHFAFPLDRLTYHEDELLDVARRTQRTALLFYHPPVWQLDRLFSGALMWSGYVGDAVAGSHLKDTPSATLEEAQRRHINGRIFVRSTRLHRCSDEDLLPYIGGAPLDPSVLTLDEQVLFSEAVPKFTEPLVLLDGFEYRTPLINSPWMDFMFSVPAPHRRDERLMIQIGKRLFPALFDLPAKTTLGFTLGAPPSRVRLRRVANKARKALHQVIPSVTYPSIIFNDLNEGIRTSPDLRRIVLDNVHALKRRGIIDWIDVDGLVRQHMSRLRNLGDALVVLASLELILDAGAATG